MDILIKKILSNPEHTYNIISYKGIGRLPKNLRGNTDPKKRILLDRLPKILAGYGKSQQYFDAAVVVVVDLDDKDCIEFKKELLGILNKLDPKPKTLFRIAIEESEAWLLGDRQAIFKAYPKANKAVLDSYRQDSICGTWEKLADAIYQGGAKKLKKIGWPVIGQEKCKWAGEIAPYMDIEHNSSRSFQVFRDGLRRLADML